MPVSSGFVVGIVTDRDSGLPLPGVAIRTGGNASTTISGPKGEYLVVGIAGTCLMTATKAGYQTFQCRLQIVGSTTRKKNFSMARQT